MRRPRQAWRQWPRRCAVRCKVRELGPKRWHAEYVLECGHIITREGGWVGPFPAGDYPLQDSRWRVHCGACFHELPEGHRCPYEARSAFFEQFDGGVQLSLDGLDDD